MTENCKHKNSFIHQRADYTFFCEGCGEDLLPTWTAKPEPLRVEFECIFIKFGEKDFRPATLSGLLDLPDEVQGKRFKITAEEIVE